MLTYRTGAAGAPRAARNMAEHLLQQTLSPEMAVMAEYYEQGMTPPTQAEGGKDGYEPGSIGWVSFDHYAARPTVAVVTRDGQGYEATELHSVIGSDGRVPGDMQVHSHVAVFNVVQTASGRVGGLDLAQ